MVSTSGARTVKNVRVGKGWTYQLVDNMQKHYRKIFNQPYIYTHMSNTGICLPRLESLIADLM